jgi:hypothetical protein
LTSAGIAAATSSHPAFAAGTVTYSATQTIPVPPASTYAGSGGGDGWAVALSSGAVYNVFHHSSSLTVACHQQSDASACWPPETIIDANGHQFATSGHPGLWLDQSTGKLYVFATRDDSTAGVVCIDTAQAATNTNPFCGFTALTAVGDAPDTGISGLSEPALVGTRWFAFNYVSGAPADGDKNSLLCFDVAAKAACASQPFAISFGAGNISAGTYPEPQVAAIGDLVIVTASVSAGDQLSCFDPASGHTCSGTWPVGVTSYASAHGAPFPLLSRAGAVNGLCLPTGSDPCYDLTGASVATPSGMSGAIPATSGWNGQAVVLGPRVYVPNGNSNAVDCYDASTDASCTNFPKTLPNLSLLYTVNADPQRPTCIWVNADNGTGQIQNFDAYTGGACGQGPIRVLASSFVVPTQLCQPASYTSLQVTSPAPGSYTSGSVAFEDGDANALSGVPDKTLDANGTVDLSGLNLSTNVGLPQFLITLNGAQGAPGAVTVKLTWTGTDDPSCVNPGTVVTSGTDSQYVALGDSFSAGEGVPDASGNFIPPTNTSSPQDRCHRSYYAYSQVVAGTLGFPAKSETAFWACSGAIVADFTHPNANNHEPSQESHLLNADGSPNGSIKLVTLTMGGNDIEFPFITESCLLITNCQFDYSLAIKTLINHTAPRLTEVYRQILHDAPNAQVYVLGYPRIVALHPSYICQVDGIQPGEAAWFASVATQLDNAVSHAVSAVGSPGRLHYISTLNSFAGGEACSKSGSTGGGFVNGIVARHPVYSFHPNQAGQVIFASLLAHAVRGN